MLHLARQLPAQGIRNLEKALKKFFDDRSIPYNKDTLGACLVMCNLISPQLPPVYGEFVAAAIMGIYRLMDEQTTGAIASDVLIMPKPLPKKDDEQHPPEIKK